MSAIRVAIRASRLDRPLWQTALIARLRALPEVEVAETYESRLLRPADLFIDPSEAAPVSGGPLYPRLGIWRFIYGVEGRLTAPGSREHAAGERGAMVRLVSLAPDGTARLLECGVFKAVAHSLSATRARMFDTVSSWPARALQRMKSGALRIAGAEQVAVAPWVREPPPSFLSSPSSAVTNIARRMRRELVEEHWALGVIRKPVHHVIHAFDPNDIQWLTPPDGMVLADPAGAIEQGGRLTVLAEAYDFNDRMGRIVALDVEDQRIVTAPREVLRLPVHVSYPHLISDAGQLYCLPEASATRQVQLFRAVHFPDRWAPDRVLLRDFAGADSTVYRHRAKWWMFTGNHEDQDESHLYVFHADDLFGPWLPHALNPVKCDLRSSRPAGPLFEHDGALYRPAQDGSVAYGGAVAVNRVLTLSPTEFAEETVNVLRPAPCGPRPHGLHTLTGAGGFTLVDGKRHARSFKRLAWGLKQLARERVTPSPAAAPDDGSPQAR